MSVGYRLAKAANVDLIEILEFVEDASGPSRALHVLDELESAFDTLSHSPNIGFHRHELTGSVLRWWPVIRFLVLYDPESDPLVILRILHGSRNVEKIFE